VTYDGKPLYTFSLDGRAGQAKGNGFTDAFGGTQFKWHAAVVSGTASAPSSSDGNGYGY
jgi:predicted lipoprotein with Yx(FWY)xxD motif